MRQINIEVPVGAGGVKIEQRIAVYGNFFAVIEAKKNIIVRPDTGDISAATGFQMEKGDNLRLTTHFETLWIKAGPDQTETEIVKIIVGEGEFNKQATLGEVTVGEITGEVSIDGEVSTRGITTVDGTVTIAGTVQTQGLTDVGGIIRTAPDYSSRPPTDFENVFTIRHTWTTNLGSKPTMGRVAGDGFVIRPGGQNNTKSWYARILEATTTNIIRLRDGQNMTETGAGVWHPTWLFGLLTNPAETTRAITSATTIRKLNLNEQAAAPPGSIGGLPFARTPSGFNDTHIDILLSKDSNGALFIVDSQGTGDDPTGVDWQLGSTDWTDVDGYYLELDNAAFGPGNPGICFLPIVDYVAPEGNPYVAYMDLNLKVAVIPVPE